MCKYKLFSMLVFQYKFGPFEPLSTFSNGLIQQLIVLNPAHCSAPVFKVFILSSLLINLCSIYFP